MNLGDFIPWGAPGCSLPTAEVNFWWESILWIPYFWSKALHTDRETQVKDCFTNAENCRQREGKIRLIQCNIDLCCVVSICTSSCIILWPWNNCYKWTFASWKSTNMGYKNTNPSPRGTVNTLGYIFDELLVPSTSSTVVETPSALLR